MKIKEPLGIWQQRTANWRYYKHWELAKNVLTQEELNNMFLAKDGSKRTAWHMAAINGQLEELQTVGVG
jgi:hypothetical protein